jgi:hypothetical protein
MQIINLFIAKIPRLASGVCLFLFGLPSVFGDTWDGGIDSIAPSPTNANVYYVRRARQLAWIANQVNTTTNSFTGKTIILTDNLDLGGAQAVPLNWVPIGINSDHAFQGSFNGNNKIISHLYISNSSVSYENVGLFGYVANKGKVNDATIQSVTINNGLLVINGVPNVGALVGYTNGNNDAFQITISDCHVKDITITQNNQYSTKSIGGLAGVCNDYTAIKNSDASNISIHCQNQYVGGLVGYIGQNDSCAISSCYASGSLTNTYVSGENQYSGGLVGESNRNSTIVDSHSSVEVHGAKNSGGLVGYLKMISTKPALLRCYATGNVFGMDKTGGLVGNVNSGSISQCFATGCVSGLESVGGLVGNFTTTDTDTLLSIINDCFAMGSVTGTFPSTGGFVGSMKPGGSSLSITDSYAVGFVNSTTASAGGFVGSIDNTSNRTSSISRSYATGNVIIGGGGFVGEYKKGTCVDNLFDQQGTGCSFDVTNGSNNLASPLLTINMTNSTVPTALGSAWTMGTAPSGYYPQLKWFFESSDSIVRAWSALSVVPVSFYHNGAFSDHSNAVTCNFVTPLKSASNAGKMLSWSPAYQSTEQGRLFFSQNKTGIISPLSVGQATFQTIDRNGYTKKFHIVIHGLNAYFVRSGKSGAGTSWSDAMGTLQEAVETANKKTPKANVFVAAGSYKNEKIYSTSDFLMHDGVNVYGGFPDSDVVSPELRFKAGTSILSGTTNETVLSGESTALSTKTIWDGFTFSSDNSDPSQFVAIIPANGVLQNSIFTGCKGATLNLPDGSEAYNILIANNGGNAVTMTGSAKLINATIVRNGGAGISVLSGNPIVTNSILWKNKQNISGTATVTYCAASSDEGADPWPSSGIGNIELFQRSPNFKTKSNYALLLISPCLGKGLPTANPISVDINGNPRVCNNSIDIGAFEKWDGITVSGNSVSNLRTKKLYTVEELKTCNKDTLEMFITPSSTFNLEDQAVNAKWLELYQDSITNPPILKNGTFIADSVLYARRFSKMINGLGVWNFFGIPFNTAPLSTIDGSLVENSVRINAYDEHLRALQGANKSAWIHLQPDTTTLHVGVGYALSFNNKVPVTDIGRTVIFSSKGTISPVIFNKTTQSVSLHETASNTLGVTHWYDCGWNLIANPMPQTGGINNVWNSSADSYFGAAYFYKSYTDSYDIRPASDLLTGSYAIAPYAGFFIQTDVNGATAEFMAVDGILPSSLRSMAYSRSVASNPFPVKSAIYQFNIAGEGDYANAYVIFTLRGHREMIPMEDAPTLSGLTGRPALSMSTSTEDSKVDLAINRLPLIEESLDVPLKVYVPYAGSYTITMPQSDTIATSVMLRDEKGVLHSLNDNDYHFTVNENGVSKNYTLIFGDIHTHNQVSLGITIFQNHRNVTLSSISIMQQVILYGENGEILYSQKPFSNQTNMQLPDEYGLFLLKIIIPEGVVTKKLINR